MSEGLGGTSAPHAQDWSGRSERVLETVPVADAQASITGVGYKGTESPCLSWFGGSADPGRHWEKPIRHLFTPQVFNDDKTSVRFTCLIPRAYATNRGM